KHIRVRDRRQHAEQGQQEPRRMLGCTSRTLRELGQTYFIAVHHGISRIHHRVTEDTETRGLANTPKATTSCESGSSFPDADGTTNHQNRVYSQRLSVSSVTLW